MILNVLWMYHDIMDLYGDSGNIKVIIKRCKDRNIDVKLDTLTLNQKVNLSNYDLVFFGGGADNEQNIIYKDLLNRRQDIITAINNNTFFLLICGGYQMFGQYYKDRDNNIIDGLKIFDYYTEANGNDRCIGNILIDVELDEYNFQVIGFENHGGQTKNVSKPLGKVLTGHGNTYKGKYEGIYYNNCIGTYLHGPLLPKNPQLADFIIYKALSKRYNNFELKPLDDTLESLAFNTLKHRIYKK